MKLDQIPDEEKIFMQFLYHYLTRNVATEGYAIHLKFDDETHIVLSFGSEEYVFEMINRMCFNLEVK